jgi:hypothetical protein|tara:strand:+ start:34 stop:258 length:225 start_codon:yes stop_codon:yes gene_type:complete
MKKSKESIQASHTKKAHSRHRHKFLLPLFLIKYAHQTRARENEKKETLNSNTIIIIVEKLFFSSVVIIEQSNNG